MESTLYVCAVLVALGIIFTLAVITSVILFIGLIAYIEDLRKGTHDG